MLKKVIQISHSLFWLKVQRFSSTRELENHTRPFIKSGYQDLSKIFDEDKSQFIKDLIQNGAACNLICRPRRWGKSLNLSMLLHFFSILPHHQEFMRKYGEQLIISKIDGGYYKKHFANKFSVLNFDFGQIVKENYKENLLRMEDLYIGIGKVIKQALSPYQFLFEKPIKNTYFDSEKMSESQRLEAFNNYQRIRTWVLNRQKENDENLLEDIFSTCCEFIHEAMVEKNRNGSLIILIDEYDSPIQKLMDIEDDAPHLKKIQHQNVKMILRTLKDFLEYALKKNAYLYTSVITGVQKISGQTLFSGLNHISYNSMLSEEWNQYYGVTEKELHLLLKDLLGKNQNYDQGTLLKLLQDNYNGYKTRDEQILYNTWSITNYLRSFQKNSSQNMQIPEAIPYWVNSGSDSMLASLVMGLTQTDLSELVEVIKLAKGETKEVQKEIFEHQTLNTILENSNNIWTLLFYSGYVTLADVDPVSRNIWKLKIPNEEVRKAYDRLLDKIEKKMLGGTSMLTCFETGDFNKFETQLNYKLSNSATTSSFKKEEYYRDLIGVIFSFGHSEWWNVEMETTAAIGTSDIRVFSNNPTRDVAYIFELKVARNKTQIESLFGIGLEQIQNKKYYQRLINYQNIKRLVCYTIVGFERQIRFSEKEEYDIISTNSGTRELVKKFSQAKYQEKDPAGKHVPPQRNEPETKTEGESTEREQNNKDSEIEGKGEDK